ncbi:MAG: energy transducer TonB [Geobacteraceae bacterium]|nr:energy transducer TonB [Geobacteraceae bacterium]
MSDKYIEKSFLYFVVLSLLVHVVVGTVFYLMPEKKREVKQTPYMVELSDLPEMHEMPGKDVKTKRFAEKRSRVARETAPKGDQYRNRTSSLPPAVARRPSTSGRPLGETVPELPGASVLRPESAPDMKKLPALAKLYPSAERMAQLEESYRKKYDAEIAKGETLFLNSDDIQFGSFLRRFETAVYAVWVYPAAAARAGIHGVTPVKITFNRKGDVENVQLLRSSGSRILDDEVLRALHSLGPIGNLPKNYDKDHFNLIAFFEYVLVGGSIQGTIR